MTSFLKGIPLSMALIFLVLAGPACADDAGFAFQKDTGISEVKPKKPVRIRLKRSKEGKYEWEITGDDTEEIIRADRELKRRLDPNEGAAPEE